MEVKRGRVVLKAAGRVKEARAAAPIAWFPSNVSITILAPRTRAFPDFVSIALAMMTTMVFRHFCVEGAIAMT